MATSYHKHTSPRYACVRCGKRVRVEQVYCRVCAARWAYVDAQMAYYRMIENPSATEAAIVGAWRAYHLAFMAYLAAVGKGGK